MAVFTKESPVAIFTKDLPMAIIYQRIAYGYFY
jgi:hypothetical protein